MNLDLSQPDPPRTGRPALASGRPVSRASLGSTVRDRVVAGLRVLLVVTAVLSVVLYEFVVGGGPFFLRYFTFWSITLVAVAAVLGLVGIRGAPVVWLRDAACTSAVVSGVVNAWLVEPLGDPGADVAAWGNVLQHGIIPLIAVSEFLVAGRAKEPGLLDGATWVAIPATYLGWTFLADALAWSAPVYPFLDPAAMEAAQFWQSTALVGAVLVAVVVGMVVTRAVLGPRSTDAGQPAGAPTASSERYRWVDVAKGGAIFGVAVVHVGIDLRSLGYDVSPVWTALPLVQFLPVWFVLSGLFVGRSLGGPVRALFRRRIAPLVYLYLSWSLLYLAFYAVRAAASSQRSVREEVRAELYLFLTFNSVLWFVMALAVYIAITVLLRRVPPVWQIVPAAALSVLAGAQLVHVGSWGIDHGLQYLVFFMVGCHAAAPILAWSNHAGWRSLARSLVLWLGAILVLGQFGELGTMIGGVVVPVAAVFVAMSLAIVFSRFRVSRVVELVGRHTLTVYVAHTLVIVCAGMVLYRLVAPPGGPVFGLLALPVVTVLAVALPIWAEPWFARLPWLFMAPGPIQERLRLLLLGVLDRTGPIVAGRSGERTPTSSDVGTDALRTATGELTREVDDEAPHAREQA